MEIKKGYVLSSENDNGSPEWMKFLNNLKKNNKELRFVKHYKTTKIDKFEIVDKK